VSATPTYTWGGDTDLPSKEKDPWLGKPRVR